MAWASSSLHLNGRTILIKVSGVEKWIMAPS